MPRVCYESDKLHPRLVSLDPFYEALFFVSAITFLQMYMIALIKDLDNPFEYYGKNKGSNEISLKPLDDLRLRVKEKIRLCVKNS